MEKNIEKRAYVKPEAEILPLLMNENIAASKNTVDRFFDDEFNGEDDEFA